MLCNLLSVKVTRNVNAIMRIFRLYKQKSSCGTANASARMILRRRRYHWPQPSSILGRRNKNFYSLNLSKQKYQITLLLFVKASFVLDRAANVFNSSAMGECSCLHFASFSWYFCAWACSTLLSDIKMFENGSTDHLCYWQSALTFWFQPSKKRLGHCQLCSNK